MGLTSILRPPTFPGMAAVVPRVLTLCLAVAFSVSLMAQLMPSSIAETQMGVSAEMGGGCDGPQSPCARHVPNCAGHVCCVTVSALPPSALSAVAFEWASLDYIFAPGSLSGITVEPELAPPILTA